MLINSKLLFSVSNMVKTFEVLLISVLLSRFYYDKNELGQLLQILFIASIIITLLSGIPLSLNFFHGKYNELKQKQSLFINFFLLLIIASLAFCFLLLISKSYISFNFQNELFLKYIYLIILYYFFRSTNTIFPNYHYLKDRLFKYLQLYVFTFAILVACFFYDNAIGALNAKIVLTQLLFIELIRFVFNVLIINKRELRLSLKDFNSQEMIYILTITVGVVAGAFGLYVDKYLIATLLNPTEFVYYQNGAINLPFVNIITSSLFIALIPTFAELYTKKKNAELVLKVRTTILKCSLLLMPILVYCFFEAIPLIKFLYGDEFEISGEVFKIYVLRYSLSVMAFSVFMGSIGLEKKANLVIFLSALIGLFLNIILIPMYGIKGASVATVIASLSTIVISLYFIKKRLMVKIVDYFPIVSYIKIILISFMIYTPFYLLNRYIDKDWSVVLSSLIYYICVIKVLNSIFTIFKFRDIVIRK